MAWLSTASGAGSVGDYRHECAVRLLESVITVSDPQPIETIFGDQATNDYRWVGPTHVCVCGCSLFHVVASFDEGVVAFYFTTAMCVGCGALVTVPTEVDENVFD